MSKNVTNLFATALPNVEQAPIKLWKGFIKNLELQASIGIYEEEFTKLQKISISVEYDYQVITPRNTTDDSQVVCYVKLCQSIEKLILENHIYFVENLAEEVANICFLDGRIQQVKVHVEKFPSYINAQSLGVQIIRNR